ncbi:MAG: response regulator transcription factor [Proteobacteria bacterium]|nr:response regulator transcription factor [Pseudomonadota bacterium]MBU1740768.1 response regulator transcription factor [Pseudomonadota bacterium]
MSVRIVIVDDHQIVRDGLRSVMEKEGDLHVVAEADNGRDGVRVCRELGPDVVIMDITMPDLNGIEAARKIGADCPDTRVIALSMHSDKRYVTRMLEAGAAGYLLKESAIDEVVRAVRAVAAGQSYLSPPVADIVIADFRVKPRRRGEAEGSVLTDREREVLQLLAEGRTSKEIAGALDVSPKTVEAHRRQIMDKLDIHSVAGLTKYAIRDGLTSVDD